MNRNKKNCLNCGKAFLPTPRRNGHERAQEYCSDSDCRKESRRKSRRRYRAKKKNDTEFMEKECERVKKWQKANPGYKKRQRLKKNQKKITENRVLRDLICEEINAETSALRDLINRQVLINKGVISLQFDVLRDEIAPLENRLYDRGKELSDMVSESEKSLTDKGGNHHEQQKVNLP
jgi:hypothetical protein